MGTMRGKLHAETTETTGGDEALWSSVANVTRPHGAGDPRWESWPLSASSWWSVSAPSHQRHGSMQVPWRY